MRHIVLLVPVILLAAACTSGKPVPAGKPAASPSASSSASAPKTAAPSTSPSYRPNSWCAKHPDDGWCHWNPTDTWTPPVPTGSEWSSYFSSALDDTWKQMCEEKNPASACEATPSR
ncbi:hypothetical protein [Streptomyces sp. NPDC002550]